MSAKSEIKKEFYRKRNKKIFIQNENLKRHAEQQEKAFVAKGGVIDKPNNDGLQSDWRTSVKSMRSLSYINRSKRRSKAAALFR